MIIFLIFITVIIVIWVALKPKINNQQKQAFTQINQTIHQVLTDNTVILDTETNGLDYHHQIIEICILDRYGECLLNTYVKPKRKMGKNNQAVAIHGITDEMLVNAPTWDKIHQQVCEILHGKIVITYNAKFDLRLLEQTIQKYDLVMPDCTFECAMNLYTAYHMIKHNEEPRKHKLTDACYNLGIKPHGQIHRASTDCMMTLDLLNTIEKQTR